MSNLPGMSAVAGSESCLLQDAKRRRRSVLMMDKRRRISDCGLGDNSVEDWPEWRIAVTPSPVIKPKSCDEVPDEFKRAGIGLCFGGTKLVQTVMCNTGTLFV